MIFQIHVAKCVWNFLSFRRWKCWWRRKKWDWRHHPGSKHEGKNDLCVFLVVWWMYIIKKILQKYNNLREEKREWLQKFDLVPGAVHNFICCLLTYIFIYDNILKIVLCFKAKGHGTRMTSEEQSLKWWGFLQDEMRFTLFCVISRTLFYQDYIYMYIILTKCSRFNVDIYPITLREFSETYNIYSWNY